MLSVSHVRGGATQDLARREGEKEDKNIQYLREFKETGMEQQGESNE